MVYLAKLQSHNLSVIIVVINGNKTILLSLSHPLWMAFFAFLITVMLRSSSMKVKIRFQLLKTVILRQFRAHLIRVSFHITLTTHWRYCGGFSHRELSLLTLGAQHCYDPISVARVGEWLRCTKFPAYLGTAYIEFQFYIDRNRKDLFN